jgi:hypothetical protein
MVSLRCASSDLVLSPAPEHGALVAAAPPYGTWRSQFPTGRAGFAQHLSLSIATQTLGVCREGNRHQPPIKSRACFSGSRPISACHIAAAPQYLIDAQVFP